MLECAALGSDDFLLGFQLAGIKQAIIAEKKPYRQMKEIMAAGKAGIVITEEGTMNSLESYEREEIEDSANPVFITVSESADDTRLQRIILETIGVNIWQQQ